LLNIDHINDDVVRTIEKALLSYPFDQYAHYPAREKTAWVSYLLSSLKRVLKDEEWFFFYDEANGSPCLLGCKVSKWDEDHFGFKMASLQLFISPISSLQVLEGLLDECLARLREQGVKFVSARIHGDHISAIHVFEAQGFRYYEDVVWPVASCKSITAKLSPQVRLMRASDLAEVSRIAENYQYQRGHFHCDERFDRVKVDSMYAKWVQTAWKNQDFIGIVEDDGRVAGYFVCKMDQDLSDALGFKYGRMRSLALDGKIRGKGLGIALFEGVMILMKELGAEYIDSGYASKNHVSARLHVKTSFYSVYEEVTFHQWL
jgi:L-amino acid N-acyltransferase YncA